MSLSLIFTPSASPPPDCHEDVSDGYGGNCASQAISKFCVAVPSFIGRSHWQCALKRLHFHQDTTVPSNHEVLPLLRAVERSVEHLEILVGSYEIDKVLAWLTARPSLSAEDFEAGGNADIPKVGITCHRLHHLVITITPDYDDAPEEYSSAVVDMIECRWNSSRGSELFVQGQYIGVGIRIGHAVEEAMVNPADVTRLEVLAASETGALTASLKLNSRIRLTTGVSYREVFRRFIDTWRR